MVANRTTAGRGDAPQSTHQSHLQAMVDYYHRTARQYNSWHCNPADDSSHNYAVNEVLRLLARKPDSSLLDVCCGTGRCIRAALDAGYDAKGIDISPDLLAQAEKTLGVPAERLHRADATQMPFPDKSFDVSCILGALHHTARPHAIVAEMIRVTRRAMVVSDEANHLHGGVRQILKSLGIFDPVYRLIFRREPRTTRRLITTEGDGPAFDFTIEEILPALRADFQNLKCLTFYRLGGFQVCAWWLPRLFARQGVIVAEKGAA